MLKKAFKCIKIVKIKEILSKNCLRIFCCSSRRGSKTFGSNKQSNDGIIILGKKLIHVCPPPKIKNKIFYYVFKLFLVISLFVIILVKSAKIKKQTYSIFS